jgi:hypothetical protein
MSLLDHGKSAASETHPCLIFLSVLDPHPDARFNIECYTDVPKGMQKPKPDLLMRHFSDLTLKGIVDLIPELESLNSKGAGIFTTVNRCRGRRSKNNVIRVRAVHADVDAASDQQREKLIRSLAPSIIVTSSEPTKLHLYWKLDDAAAKEKEAVSKINQLLASDYGADNAATDISRILRLPGFKHMKYRHLGQTPVVKAAYNNGIYSVEEVQAAFLITQPTPTQYQTRRKRDDALSKIEAKVMAEMKARCPQLWSGAWEDA